MDLPTLLETFRLAPLVASAQASEGSPLADVETLLRLAQSSLNEGVRVLRLQGGAAIRRIRPATKAPVIGLVKRHYDGSPVYITPTQTEVDELLASECEVIGLDATLRPRPGGCRIADLVARVKQAGRLAMADCDTLESAIEAERLGFDIAGTTLAGYTENRAMSTGPDLELLRQFAETLRIPVIAEGRYSEGWQVLAATRIGAKAVVMGAALNDTPVLTRRYAAAARPPEGTVGAVDIGGTWLRYALFSSTWEMLESAKVETPPNPAARLDWMRGQIERTNPARVGVSSGGIVDPETGIVTRAKAIISGHVGSEFSESTLGRPVRALNDGLATAWGHACLPEYAGRRVATLALGTGVGFGLVERGRIVMGSKGEPSHLNDLMLASGRTIEQTLGGAFLDGRPSEEAKAAARRALEVAEALFHPDATVLCGGVGLCEWLDLELPKSPFGADAGLFGAAALALFPLMAQ